MSRRRPRVCFRLTPTCYLAQWLRQITEQLLVIADPGDRVSFPEVRTTATEWRTSLEQYILPIAKEPPFNESQKINVHLLFSSFDHVVLDQENQILRVSGRVCLVWNDQRLLWDPAEYDGITDIHVTADDIWHPQFKTSAYMYTPHWRASKETIHIYVNKLRTRLVYLATCPQFTIKTGCALDMSFYPYDEHVCTFLITVLQWENIHLLSFNSINDQQARMRHVLTRNETRPSLGDFTVASINSTSKWSDGYKLYDAPEEDSYIPLAVQMVTLRRHYNAFMATFGIPALIFAGINVTAALMPYVKHALLLYLVNIGLLGLFFRDAVGKFPLYYSRTPDIILHFYTSFFLAIIGLFYLAIKEMIYQNRGATAMTEKFPNTGDGREWQNVFLGKIFSIDFFIILSTFITSVWYII